MTEFYIEGNSFAAPIASDTCHRYVEATSPKEALAIFKAEYTHPAKLYFAGCWLSADAKNKGANALAEYHSSALAAQKEATKGLGAYIFHKHRRGTFEVDGVLHTYDPEGEGVIVAAESDAA